jgi:hypothetical protein
MTDLDRAALMAAGVVLSGCVSNYPASPVFSTYDLQQRRGACLMQDYQNQSQVWDDRTQTCYQLSPEQTAERRRRAQAAWNKQVETQREQAARFQRQHPDADACIKRNAGTFTQSYSGQLMELCLSVEEKP